MDREGEAEIFRPNVAATRRSACAPRSAATAARNPRTALGRPPAARCRWRNPEGWPRARAAAAESAEAAGRAADDAREGAGSGSMPGRSREVVGRERCARTVPAASHASTSWRASGPGNAGRLWKPANPDGASGAASETLRWYEVAAISTATVSPGPGPSTTPKRTWRWPAARSRASASSSAGAPSENSCRAAGGVAAGLNMGERPDGCVATSTGPSGASERLSSRTVMLCAGSAGAASMAATTEKRNRIGVKSVFMPS